MPASTAYPRSRFPEHPRAFYADASVVRATRRSFGRSKERRAQDPEHGNNEGSIEIVVAHLAGGLGDQGATVASGSMEPALFHARPRRVLGTDRVIGAQLSHPQRQQEMIFDVPRFLD